MSLDPKVRALRASDKVLDLADFLAADPARQSKTAKELMNLLNSGGIQTSRGKIWSVSALRRPLRKAREELKVRAELDAMPDDPDMLPGAQAQPDATYPIGHESGSSGTEVTKVKSPLEIRLQVQKQRRDKQDEAFKHIPGYGAFGS